MTFNTFFLIRLLLLHRSESSYEPASVCIYQTAHKPSFFFVYVCLCVREVSVWERTWCAHMSQRSLWSAADRPRISTLTFNSPKGTRQENLHAYWPDGGGFLWGLFEWRGAWCVGCWAKYNSDTEEPTQKKKRKESMNVSDVQHAC